MSILLTVVIVDQNATKKIQFDADMEVFDVCRQIGDRIKQQANPKDFQIYGLFLPDNDSKNGVWMDPGRSLSYYELSNNSVVEYKGKIRPLKVCMLDETVKTLLVDDSQTVGNLMVTICSKIGISNHEEYSLVLKKEEPRNVRHNTGTLTLRRRKGVDDKQVDAKMETLRKKLKTEDEIGWLNHNQTLQDQGVDGTVPLLLRRKFFFSDKNVDGSDPIQLNLLYVQCRDSITNGTHPVTEDIACQFAALQCQIQFGDYQQGKQSSRCLSLKEFVPQCYAKTKGIERKINGYYEKHERVSELEAKVKYVRLARSLHTYGVSFFLVKEQLSGKKKLVPCLLGITKSSIVRLDQKTKEIINQWPLTSLRRWSATPNVFTFDFGDHSDEFYSVQTSEGPQIDRILSGYIDIIVKNKPAKEWSGMDSKDDAILVEQSISPNKATIIQRGNTNFSTLDESHVATSGIFHVTDGQVSHPSGGPGAALYGSIRGQVKLPQGHSGLRKVQVSSLSSGPQKALINTIEVGHEAIDAAKRDLDVPVQLPEIGSDSASLQWKETTINSNRQGISSHLAAMNAATAQVVTLTSDNIEQIDYIALGDAISTISTNSPSVAQCAKTIAALVGEDRRIRLLSATRETLDAFNSLLGATEPDNIGPHQNMLKVASRVGETSGSLLNNIVDGTVSSSEAQNIVLGLSKAVANATAAFILNAKNVASQCADEQQQNRVIGAATQCALTTSQLVAIAKVVSPTIEDDNCQQHMVAASKEVVLAVKCLSEECSLACSDAELLEELYYTASAVSKACDDLLNHVRTYSRPKINQSSDEACIKAIIATTDKISNDYQLTKEFFEEITSLTQATSLLIDSIKDQAQTSSQSEIQPRLLNAAESIATCTCQLISAVRLSASNPKDVNQHETLRNAAQSLNATTRNAAPDVLRKQLVESLATKAKYAVESASQCVASAKNAAPYTSDSTLQHQMLVDCEHVSSRIDNLAECVEKTSSDPKFIDADLDLLRLCRDFAQSGYNMVDSVSQALPTLNENVFRSQLSSNAEQFNADLTELHRSIVRAQYPCGALEIDEAIDSIRSLDADLKKIKTAADASQLKPLPGEDAETAAIGLKNTRKTVGSKITQLLTAVSEGHEELTGQAAKQTVSALTEFNSAVRAVAATTSDRMTQHSVVDAAHEVMRYSIMLIEGVKVVISSPHSTEGITKLNTCAQGVSDALIHTVDCIPGQCELNEVLNYISGCQERLSNSFEVSSDKSYRQLHSEITSLANKLNDISDSIASSSGVNTSGSLKSLVHEFGSTYSGVFDVGLAMAAVSQDEVFREIITGSLGSLCESSFKLVNAVKVSSLDSNAPNSKIDLTDSARLVTDAINSLMVACTSAVPGRKECDDAICQIQSLSNEFSNPLESANGASYFHCLDVIMDKSKFLSDGMTGLANHIRTPDVHLFKDSVATVTDSICGILKSAGQINHVIVASDPTSAVFRPGLVDQGKFVRIKNSIEEACRSLIATNANQQQVLSAATQIAKHTSALCTDCRTASTKSSDPATKRDFVQAARDVANATSTLVKQIKALDQHYCEHERRGCAEVIDSLLMSVNNLCVFANSPEFASTPAQISEKTRQKQKPIAEASKLIIEGACDLISAAGDLNIESNNPLRWQVLAEHSKSVSDRMKLLVSSIRDGAPGVDECDNALHTLRLNGNRLNQASMSISNQSMSPNKVNSLESCSDESQRAARHIFAVVDEVRMAGKSQAERLGHVVTYLASLFDSLVPSVIGMISHMINTEQQIELIDQTRAMTDCASEVLTQVRQAGGNMQAIHLHPGIDEAADALKDASGELVASIERHTASAGLVNGVVEAISSSMVKCNDNKLCNTSSDGANSFVEFQTKMASSLNEIKKLSHEMARSVDVSSQQLGHFSSKLSASFIKLAGDARGTWSQQVGGQLHTAVQDLGQACIALVKAGGVCQALEDQQSQKQVNVAANAVQDVVADVFSALKSGSSGTQACIDAASTVSGIIADLDTTIVFATTGTLPSDETDVNFSDHSESILKTAKALVEDSKALVAGAASTQEQLAVAAQNVVETMTQLSNTIKVGASLLGPNNSDGQVMLMNSVRNVASALGDLIQSTSAAGKSSSDPSMQKMKDSAKAMVINVTSLLNTIKLVGDKDTRGTRALESFVEYLDQEIDGMYSDSASLEPCPPEDIVKAAGLVTQATAKLVAAGSSCKQDDVVAAVNLGRRAVSSVISACKRGSYNADESLRRNTLESGLNLAFNYKELSSELLKTLKHPSPNSKQALAAVSFKIAQCATNLTSCAKNLKGDDWVDADDPTTIAENELLIAAASIDMAAKKLNGLILRQPVKKADEDMKFDALILQSCEAIAKASSALIKAASSAQRELVSQGVVMAHTHYVADDTQWSEGLISAAKLVSMGTNSLCHAANCLVQGEASEELLISAAKQVAQSTAQLLVACKVKADPHSKSSQRLQAAGNDVMKATDNLVTAAQAAIDRHEDTSIVPDLRLVGGYAQVLDAQSEIERKERELIEARHRLAFLRKAKYSNCPENGAASPNTSQVSSQREFRSPAQAGPGRFNVAANVSQLSDDVSNMSIQSTHSDPDTISQGPSFSESMRLFQDTTRSRSKPPNPT